MKRRTTHFLEPGERKPPLEHGQGLPITLVTPGMAAGGAERQTVDLAVGLKQLGFAPVVVSAGAQHQPDHPEFIQKLAAAGVPYGMRAPNEEIASTMERGKATLWWGAALLRTHLQGIPIPGSIYIAHGSSDTAAELVRECAPAIGRGVGVCRDSARILDRVLEVDDSRVIWNGVEPAEMPHVWKSRLSADQPFTLGYLGRYAPEKNLEAALEALALLDDRFRLRMWGWGSEKAHLAAYAARLGVGDRVDLCGKPRNRTEALTGLDALFLCSTGEGFPLVLIEAALAGVPVIYPPYGDLGVVFPHRRRGIVIQGAPPDAVTLAAAAHVYAGDPKQTTQISIEAQEYAQKHLTVDRMAREYADLISSVVN